MTTGQPRISMRSAILPQRPRWWGDALRLLLLAAVVLCVLATSGGASPAGAASAGEVTGLRFGASGTRTRVVLDLDRSVTYDVQVQTAPNQLTIDLDGVQWRVPPSAEGPPRGLVQAHRFSPMTPGKSRFVVEMAKPVRIVGAILLPPSQDSITYRLVVDVVPDPNAASAPAVQQEAARALMPAIPNPQAPPAPIPEPVPVPKPRTLPVVVLDPGHGGIDPGATAVDGDYEKDLVLEMAKELRALIERSGRYRVVLTREGDQFIQLRDRIAIARELGGNIFISIHADSLRLAEQRGASIYTLSEKASDAEAARFASQENKADILAGTDLSQHDAVVATILIDLAQRDTNNKSITFADIMSEELAAVTPMVKRHRRFAGFAVLKSPDIPSVLLELGYLSNPDDARNLAQSNYRAKLGQAIVRSLDRYFAVPRS